MPAALLLIFLLPAAADWLAVWKGWQRVSFITKPLAVLTLIIGFGMLGHFKGNLLWFGIGFCFSLLGDVFLLLSHGYFIFGLSSFLIAHLAYTVGFNSPLPKIGLPFYLLSLIIFSAWWLLRRRLEMALRASGRQSRMRPAVALYSVVIAAMLLSALLTLFRPDWGWPAAGVCSRRGIPVLLFGHHAGVRPLCQAVSPRALLGAGDLSSGAVGLGARRAAICAKKLLTTDEHR